MDAYIPTYIHTNIPTYHHHRPQGGGDHGWGGGLGVLGHIYIYMYMFMPTGWKPSERFRHFYICSLGWGGVGNIVHVLAHSHDVTPRHVHLHVRTYVMLRWRCVTSRRGRVGWGGGWGGVITFTYLRTPMMLRHGTFTCTCAHTSFYVEDVSSHAGVGWGGVITFTYLRTPMMLRHGTFTCTCAHTSCYVEDVSRHAGVGCMGCGGVITFTYLRTPMMLRHGTFTCTCAHTSAQGRRSRLWRDLIAFQKCILDRKEQWFAQMAQSVTLDWHRLTSWYILPAHIAKTNLSKKSADMLEKPSGFILAPSTRAGVWSKPVFPISWNLAQKTKKNEWPHLDVRSHMAVAMGGKCSWKRPVGENRCVLSEDVEITGKNGCRWGFGHADFPKDTFFALRHVNDIQ